MNNFQNTEICNDKVKEILLKLVKLQKEAVKEEVEDQMCDYNILGECSFKEDKINTRPLQIYTLNDKAWFCPIDRNEASCEECPHETTCVFRVEKVEGNTATFRALVEKPHNGDNKRAFRSTDSYITIKLVNIAAVRCLKDTFVDLCIH